MKSIRTKLWIGMMILVGIIIMILWLFQITFLEKFYTVLELNEIVNRAETIVKEIEELENIENLNTSSQLIDSLDEFIYDKQLTIEIVNKTNDVLYQSSAGNVMGMQGMKRDGTSSVMKGAFQGKVTKYQFQHVRFGNQFMLIGVPIYENDLVQGVMLVTMPMASVEDTVGILKKQLAIITTILIVVSVIIAFRLSKRFSDPILEISKQAEAYKLGKFDVKIKDAGQDEIGQLANRMNEMGDILMQNEHLQKEIIANVSHELRTPLSLIRGYAETLRDVTGNDQLKREKQLNIIVEESERLSDIVEDILNLSKLQTGTEVLEKEVFSLQDMLQKISDHYHLQYGARGFLIKGMELSLTNVIGDKKRMEQVLRNLIDNAFRYTNDSELVEVIVIEKEQRIKVEIKDHGEGITKEEQEHIFERYYRGKRENGKKSKGTGLGLAIVKSIMELHQMPYGVESELGKGTIFWIELEKENAHTSF